MPRKNQSQDARPEPAAKSFGSGLGKIKPLSKPIKIGARFNGVPLKMRYRAEAGTKQGDDGKRTNLDDE